MFNDVRGFIVRHWRGHNKHTKGVDNCEDIGHSRNLFFHVEMVHGVDLVRDSPSDEVLREGFDREGSFLVEKTNFTG